ncbi:unnamed protein product [Lymnaea stagnalis]|uniref:Uncharacterized protein n=1 Tax=Lymnaea stagnalis TaxID=6523 RepID=A0AAV2HX85_LYMST
MSDLVQDDLTLKGLFEGKHEVADIKMEASSLAFAFDCEKHKTYNSHDGFIPYTDFCRRSLPRRYRDPYLLDVIKVIAFLTVRIDVTYTSPARPLAYPCSESRGRTAKRSGTGRIGMVWKYTDNDHRTCPCTACKQSENPVRNWGLIRVITAVHVVYDKAEALKATCRFGYDSYKSPTVIFEGVDMERADVNDDRCHLSCVTHDLELLDKLKLQWSRYPALHRKVTEKFKRPNDKLVVIVSHPHGCSKHVSLGSWTNKVITGATSPGPDAPTPGQVESSPSQGASSPIQGASSPGQGAPSPIQDASSPDQAVSPPVHPFVKYTYTTTTCPGSSRATVYIMGRTWGLWYNQIHSGHKPEVNYNYSGNGCH